MLFYKCIYKSTRNLHSCTDTNDVQIMVALDVDPSCPLIKPRHQESMLMPLRGRGRTNSEWRYLSRRDV